MTRELFTAGDVAINAIERLETILSEAKTYLKDRHDMAAWGTLLMFDDAAEDLKAAIRLHRAANRREQ